MTPAILQSTADEIRHYRDRGGTVPAEVLTSWEIRVASAGVLLNCHAVAVEEMRDFADTMVRAEGRARLKLVVDNGGNNDVG
jgi:hypothetical protein